MKSPRNAGVLPPGGPTPTCGPIKSRLTSILLRFWCRRPAACNTVTIPTTAHVREALAGRTVYAPLVARAQDLAGAARAFHWPLEFPDVMASGGFDVVLGNPPWERIKLQEQEFFAARDPEIASAPMQRHEEGWSPS